ncbi:MULTISPECIES: ABC transporter permease [unclassified Chelatococcus]|uniref:ABC transporter permease n=1 Tax=unclassified Chelatococcus TaxID=2638111 RepID=UPI001BCC5AFA|nr:MULTISPECIES: ABC transporter permease [unclassified Chelatococcus]MBS7699907.1 ABC transporter permease [Chelatococcus sp. YT9]MBX3558747.1 ABC transporter permease [Chelatococcus sp.]
MRKIFSSPSAVLLAIVVIGALLAPVLPLHDPVAMDVSARFAPPSASHWLGQDEYGRDLLARLVFALRSAILISGSAALIAAVIGVAIGVAAGYARGFSEMISLRIMDVILCFPPLLLAMLAATFYGAGPQMLVPVLALVFVPSFTRVAHASVMTVRALDYVDAVKLMGAPTSRILWRTILPNIAGPLFVQFSFVVAMSVVLESGLSYLGLGVLPPAPSLGMMVGAARATFLDEPWLLLAPSILLTLVILLLNAFCDHLRQLLDPRRSTGN